MPPVARPKIDSVHSDVCITAEGESIPLTQPANGPKMVAHPRINGGRPTSILDVLYEQNTGKRLRKGTRAVPVSVLTDATVDWDVCDPNELTVVSAERLHTRAREGRPAVFADLKTPTAIRDRYHTGDATIRGMAEEHGITETTVSRIVHGRTYWYA